MKHKLKHISFTHSRKIENSFSKSVKEENSFRNFIIYFVAFVDFAFTTQNMYTNFLYLSEPFLYKFRDVP